jgi:transposase
LQGKGGNEAADAAFFRGKIEPDKATYGKLTPTVFGVGQSEIAPPGSAGFILSFRNLHNGWRTVSPQNHAVRSLIFARKKLVGQRVTLENQIRGLAVVFVIRLPRALTVAFIDNALKASEGIAGPSGAMRGLIGARSAVMTAVAAIDADTRPMTRASAACRRLMTIPGVGQLTALAFVAAIDDPSRIRRSRDIGAYLGLVPRRYQSGDVDYTGGISKCGDRRVRTLLYEAANVMLTRYKGQLKLKDWAVAIAKRSTMRKARVALARRLGIIMHAMLRDGTEFEPV